MPFWTSLVPETPLEEATQSFRLSARFLLDIDLCVSEALANDWQQTLG